MGSKVFRHIPLLLIPTLLYLSGCGIFSTESDSLPIQGKIRFNVAPGPVIAGDPNPPALQLSMQTEQIFNCFNYSIEYDFLRLGSILRVQLKQISIPNVCLTALGPASAVQTLDLPDGIYGLQFEHKSKSDTYRLILAESSIKVEPLAAGFTERDPTLRYIR